MERRFTLRFESGERAGERIPLPVAGATVGRRADNTLVIADGSVSGRHAELAVDGEGVRVRDLGSTNGTRVRGERVQEAPLAHGDRVHFGGVALVLEDAELAEAAPGAATDGAATGGAAEGVTRLDTARVQRGARRSGLLGLVLAVALGGAGAAAWHFGFLSASGGEGGRARLRAVEPVEGNLLAAGYSFEEGFAEGAAGWQNAEGATAFFERSTGARYSGQHGMRAELAGGERARLVSPAAPVREGRTVRLLARLRASGEAGGRAGIELLGRDPAGGGEPRSIVAWGPWIGSLPDHELIEVEAAIPAGFERARVLAEAVARGVAGDGGAPSEGADSEGAAPARGRVDLDDAALVLSGATGQPDERHEEYRLYLFGRPPQALQVLKVARPLIGELFVSLAGEQGVLARDVPMGLKREDGRFHLSLGLPSGLPADVEPRIVLRAEDAAVSHGLATVGEEGFQLRSVEFDQADVRTLLLGDGADLLGLGFPEPVRVRSRAAGDGASALIEIRPAPRELTVQLDFRAERAEAGQLAFAAEGAEAQGRLGQALELWGRLLSEAPYERRLVDRAEAARGRLVSAGLAELAEVERELERGRFFRLADLYRRAREEARAVGQRYAPSEVEERALAVVAMIDAELGELESDLARDEVERLRAIHSVLHAQGSPLLATAVADYLDERHGVDPR